MGCQAPKDKMVVVPGAAMTSLDPSGLLSRRGLHVQGPLGNFAEVS